MVQLKLPENGKDATHIPLATEDEAELARPRRPLPGQRSRIGQNSCTLLLIMAVLFSVFTIKEICDLKQQNIELMQMLALERQKDAALKLTVRDNIQPDRFMQGYTPEDVATIEEEGTEKHIQTSPTGWRINWRVFWSPPSVKPCTFIRLSKILADEVYPLQMDTDRADSLSSNLLLDDGLPEYDSDDQLDELLTDDDYDDLFNPEIPKQEMEDIINDIDYQEVADSVDHANSSEEGSVESEESGEGQDYSWNLESEENGTWDLL